MEQIVRHIMSNFVIMPHAYINMAKSKSLMSKEFLLSDKLTFISSENEELKNNIWGCQISADQQEMKILLGDCTQNKMWPEFCLLIYLKDAPTYGLYLLYPELGGEGSGVMSEPLIAVSMDGKDWMECSTYLQATFLAGMEQVKDLGLSWSKCTEYLSQFNMMQSFIKFHNSFYESKDEGQEI